MLTYELVNKTTDKFIYRYHPEGKEDFGTVIFDAKGNMIDAQNASSDEYGCYKVHTHAIDITKEQGMIAWY